MKDAILKIDRRIADLDLFNPDAISDRYDPSISALENKLDAALVAIFGNDTVEYNRYKGVLNNIDAASVSYTRETPISEVREGLRRGAAAARENLAAIRAGFIEDLEDSGQSDAGKALRAYDGLEIHASIQRAAGQLYRDGHYANAVEASVKALNMLVRLHSGVEDKDGSALMEFVFSPKNPVLKFNPMLDQSDSDEQRGFMMLFSGAVAGLRNPRAHRFVQDDPERALEFIAFVSLLAKLADKSAS